MDWLFSAKQVFLVLQPDEGGKKMAGFREGAPLSLTAKSGETIQAVMDRFNTYRGPDSQIHTLYRKDGSLISFSTVLTENTTVIVRGLA